MCAARSCRPLQKQRGQVQQAARQQTEWEWEAWPRAAWWVKGLGR